MADGRATASDMLFPLLLIRGRLTSVPYLLGEVKRTAGGRAGRIYQSTHKY